MINRIEEFYREYEPQNCAVIVIAEPVQDGGSACYFEVMAHIAENERECRQLMTLASNDQQLVRTVLDLSPWEAAYIAGDVAEGTGSHLYTTHAAAAKEVRSLPVFSQKP